MWLKINTYRKRAEITINGGGEHYLRLKEYSQDIAWENEKAYMTLNNFAFGSFLNNGSYIFACNPLGNNEYRVFSGYVRSNTNNIENGNLRWSGNQYNPTVVNHLYRGSIYAFSFMLEFISKNNGLTNNCGIDVLIGNNLIARHYITGNSHYLQNFICGGIYPSGLNDLLWFRPLGNLQFKRGYENVIIHYFNLWTQPIRLHEYNQYISSKIYFMEGDI